MSNIEMDKKNTKDVEDVLDKKNLGENKDVKKVNDQFTDELVKQLSNISSPTRKNILRANPIVILLAGLIILFIFFGFFGNDVNNVNKSNISITEFFEGIKDNIYSKVVIQDNGKISIESKNYSVITNDFVKELGANDIKSPAVYRKEGELGLSNVDLDEFVNKLKPSSLIDQIRGFIGSNNKESITKVIVDNKENIVIGVTGKNNADFFVTGVTLEQLQKKLSEKGTTLDEYNIIVENLQYNAENVDLVSLKARIENEQFERVYLIGTRFIAEKKSNLVPSFEIDWTSNVYTFTDVLQNEGIDLANENFEIVSATIPPGLTLDSVLTILTIVGFIFLGIVIFRSAQSAGGMGLMQFGQSKAKVFFGQKTDTTFKDVAGIDEASEELSEIVDFLKSPSKYIQMGARIPKGILMYGAPGTGKTLLARAIAGEAGVPFFHTSGSEFEEMLVGAGASRVRDLFAKAKKASPSLIFIDEIDAVARKRGTRMQSGSTEQTLNQILVEMDGFEKNASVIVIAATNRPDVLDKAILRPGRFDRQVRIDLPDKEGRLAILKIHASNKKFDSTVDLGRLAGRTIGFSGADLENVLNEAAIIATKEGKKMIAHDDLDEAVSKVVIGPAKKSRKRTEEELKLVAYHEAGHALVAKLTEGSIPVDKISIVSRGSTGGVTMFLPDKDENIISKKRLLADIRVSLGGRAAEEVALNDISTGASGDIEKATKVARSMVQKYGMSKDLGMIQYGEETDRSFLGYAYADSKEFSEKSAQMIDEEIRNIIGEAYKDAINIVKKNKDKLDLLASLLLDKEVVDREEFDKLFE